MRPRLATCDGWPEPAEQTRGGGHGLSGIWDRGEQTLGSPPDQSSYFRQRPSNRKKKHTPYSLAEEI